MTQQTSKNTLTHTGGIVRRTMKLITASAGLFLSLLVISAQTQAATYYFHNDHLGTPQVLSDSNQAIVWKGEYDPFGQVTETVATVEQNLRFPGQYFDAETGLHYNYFRTYDPATGRYTQSDPIGLNGGINTYGYTGGNPISYSDPSGLFRFSVDVPLLVHYVTGNEESVDLSQHPDACGYYLEDASTQTILQIARNELSKIGREQAVNLNIGESIIVSVNGQRPGYVNTIYSLGGGYDNYSASATVTQTETGVNITYGNATVFRYDRFEDPADLHTQFGFGVNPSSPLPNLYLNPYNIALHCSCQL